MADLHMMVITGGRERTEKEYSALLSSAGFRLRRVIGTPERREPHRGGARVSRYELLPFD